MICDNCVKTKKDLIAKFKKEFIQRTDIGKEYFEGDSKLMIDMIYTYTENTKNKNSAKKMRQIIILMKKEFSQTIIINNKDPHHIEAPDNSVIPEPQKHFKPFFKF